MNPHRHGSPSGFRVTAPIESLLASVNEPDFPPGFRFEPEVVPSGFLQMRRVGDASLEWNWEGREALLTEFKRQMKEVGP